MSNDLHSAMPPDEWRGNVTFFSGFFDTVPKRERRDATWDEACEAIAPADGPSIVEDKTNALYFVPCLLRDAPYVGSTAERAQRNGWGSVGMQRSAAHTTPSNFLVFDLDGLTIEQWDALRAKFDASGLTCLAYSSHSYGRSDKPGVRVRLLIPVDRALPQAEYERAWEGAATSLFCDAPGAVDKSSRKIHQQQGVWATAQERAHLAFRIKHDGAVASADALIAAAPAREVKPHHTATVAAVLNLDLMILPDATRIAAALPFIDPDDYPTWIKAGQCLYALAPHLGEEVALNLWRQYSARGSNVETDGPYSPEAKWATFAPSLPPDAAAGVLLGMARDSAQETVSRDIRAGALTETGRAAAEYLARHHRATFTKIIKEQAWG